MIGLDTNVIVRYLAQDDPIQSPRATMLFERELTRHRPGFISVIAMVETAWVLERAYGTTRSVLAAAIEGLLSTDVLVVEDEREVFGAMVALKAGRGSFADNMIAALGTRAGCAKTLTFDAEGSGLPGFAPIAPRRRA